MARRLDWEDSNHVNLHACWARFFGLFIVWGLSGRPPWKCNFVMLNFRDCYVQRKWMESMRARLSELFFQKTCFKQCVLLFLFFMLGDNRRQSRTSHCCMRAAKCMSSLDMWCATHLGSGCLRAHSICLLNCTRTMTNAARNCKWVRLTPLQTCKFSLLFCLVFMNVEVWVSRGWDGHAYTHTPHLPSSLQQPLMPHVCR